MLVMSDRGMERLFRTSVSIGADLSAAAGPVGEAAQADTDTTLHAEILAYARSRGLFAGAELGGAVVKEDGAAVVALYGEGADAEAIVAGRVASPAEAASFLARLMVAFPPARIASAAP